MNNNNIHDHGPGTQWNDERLLRGLNDIDQELLTS